MRGAFFFPSYLRFLQLRNNYRNHRKIAVNDGAVGYLGDDYLGLDPVWGYWRDAAVRIEGNAVLSAQMRFFMDGNNAAPHDQLDYDGRFFGLGPPAGCADPDRLERT